MRRSLPCREGCGSEIERTSRALSLGWLHAEIYTDARSPGKKIARQRLRVSPDPGRHVFGHGSWVFQGPKVSEAVSLDERTHGE